MYALIRTGGKQYKVSEGSIIDVEKLNGESGTEVSLDEVLLIASGDSVSVGQPLVQGAQVKAKIVSQRQDKKKIIFKKIRRQGKQLKAGHRQELTRLEVTQISA